MSTQTSIGGRILFPCNLRFEYTLSLFNWLYQKCLFSAPNVFVDIFAPWSIIFLRLIVKEIKSHAMSQYLTLPIEMSVQRRLTVWHRINVSTRTKTNWSHTHDSVLFTVDLAVHVQKKWQCLPLYIGVRLCCFDWIIWIITLCIRYNMAFRIFGSSVLSFWPATSKLWSSVLPILSVTTSLLRHPPSLFLCRASNSTV